MLKIRLMPTDQFKITNRQYGGDVFEVIEFYNETLMYKCRCVHDPKWGNRDQGIDQFYFPAKSLEIYDEQGSFQRITKKDKIITPGRQNPGVTKKV
jgi:hypothetical protein